MIDFHSIFGWVTAAASFLLGIYLWSYAEDSKIGKRPHQFVVLCLIALAVSVAINLVNQK